MSHTKVFKKIFTPISYQILIKKMYINELWLLKQNISPLAFVLGKNMKDINIAHLEG